MVFWLIPTVICLLLITYQDFKDRAVHWWLFVLTLIGVAGIQKSFFSIRTLSVDLMINFLICVAVAAMTTVVYLVKYKSSGVKKLKESFGFGDFLIIPILLLSFSPFNFIVFSICCLIMGVVWELISSLVKIGKHWTIPLAGIWSFFLAVCLLLSSMEVINLRNDNWIYIWLMN